MNFYQLIEKAADLERTGKRIIKLSIGETNLPTPPAVVRAATTELVNTKSSYGSAAGLFELREQIAAREQCSIDQVVVGPGSKHLIYALLHLLGSPNKPIVLPTPTWPAYFLMVRDLGLNLRTVETKLEDNWAFEDLPVKGAGAVLLCNPGNPTSCVYSDASVRNAAQAAEQEGVPLIIDEAYRGLSFKPIATCPGAIRVRSFSKEFCMEGWRVGYMVAPKEIAAKVLSFNQLTITCLPPFTQRAAAACLGDEQAILDSHRTLWRGRLETAQRVLSAAGFQFAPAQSGIYLFVTHPNLKDAGAFAERLLALGVAVAPGSEFGGYDRFIRICVNRGEDELREAVGIIAGAMK